MHGGDIYSRRIEYDFSVNLNPYGCPPNVLEAVRRSIDRAGHYPDIRQTRARRSLAELEGVDEECIICGNGASELIMAVCRAVNPRKALVVSPGFSGYLHALKSLKDCEIMEHLLKEEDGFRLKEDILDRISEAELLILTTPNNPTGQSIEPWLLEKIITRCEETGCKLLLDTCFQRLTADYLKGRMSGSTLFILDAFTKLMAVPGIRAGYLISSKDNISEVSKQLPEWNLSIPAEELIISGAETLISTDFLEKSQDLIRKEREFLKSELTGLGLTVYDSDTCFLLFKSGDQELYQKLLQRKLLIRDCSDFSGLGADGQKNSEYGAGWHRAGWYRTGWYRTAVKRHEENNVLTEVLRQVINDV